MSLRRRLSPRLIGLVVLALMAVAAAAALHAGLLGDALGRHRHREPRRHRPRAAHRRRRHDLVRTGGVRRLRRLYDRRIDHQVRLLALGDAAGLARRRPALPRSRSGSSRCGSPATTCRSAPSPGASASSTCSAISPCSAATTAISGIPPIAVGPWPLIDARAVYYLIWLRGAVAVVLSDNLLDSRTGRAIRALRGGGGVRRIVRRRHGARRSSSCSSTRGCSPGSPAGSTPMCSGRSARRRSA